MRDSDKINGWKQTDFTFPKIIFNGWKRMKIIKSGYMGQSGMINLPGFV